MSKQKKEPEYLTACEIAAKLKITQSHAYVVMDRLAAKGAEVIKLAGKRINKDHFWAAVHESRI